MGGKFKHDDEYIRMCTEQEAVRSLACAVIVRACRDYIKLRDRKLPNAKNEFEERHIRREMQDIIDFFLSDWFTTLTMGNMSGKKIAEALPTVNYIPDSLEIVV